MTEQATIDAVVQTITVEAPIERAFEVFTKGFDSWWPRSHHIGAPDMAEAILEGREGGRWYERGVDGSECEWGRVLAWDPPRRVVVSWHLDGDFQYAADPAKASEVEVRFTAESAGRTRVELTHRHLERHGRESGERLRAGISAEGGWAGLLRSFAEVAEKS
jgi:uncharacterized protein YndB with AHSA1/START domain